MAASIKDIARIAGVSHSTVSRALRDNPLIPSETALRIKKIADQLGYRASAVARGLVTRRTEAIGVVVTSIADPFNGEVVAGIEEVANTHGYSVILANSQADPQREMAVARSFHERRVDGIVVASSRVGALYLPALSQMEVPVVLLNNQHPSEFVHSVSIDNMDGARQAARHLLGLGHTRIAYIGDESGLESDADRLRGLSDELKRAGLGIRPEFVARGDGKPEAAGRRALELLAVKPRPTAIFCYNDMSALGVLNAAYNRGLHVPEELSISGFDDLFFAAMLQPALTTVRQPMRELGRRAMELLVDLLKGREPARRQLIKGELVVRQSTAKPPATNRSDPGRIRKPGLRNTA
jgi:DNA-binding LacI/PurR family transcriptional regulator